MHVHTHTHAQAHAHKHVHTHTQALQLSPRWHRQPTQHRWAKRGGRSSCSEGRSQHITALRPSPKPLPSRMEAMPWAPLPHKRDGVSLRPILTWNGAWPEQHPGMPPLPPPHCSFSPLSTLRRPDQVKILQGFSIAFQLTAQIPQGYM